MAEKDRISIVEDIMLEALRDALKDVRTIETRATSLTEDEVKQLIGRAPFILVEYSDGVRVRGSEEAVGKIARHAFNLYLGAKSLRSKQDAQRGSYGMIEAVRKALDGKTFRDTNDPDRRAGPFRWQRNEIFADLPGGTIYISTYTLDELIV